MTLSSTSVRNISLAALYKEGEQPGFSLNNIFQFSVTAEDAASARSSASAGSVVILSTAAPAETSAASLGLVHSAGVEGGDAAFAFFFYP